MRFNVPPGWPQPPLGWAPPPGWRPDPSWPPAPPGWQFWVTAPALTTHAVASRQQVRVDPYARPAAQSRAPQTVVGAPWGAPAKVDNTIAWALALVPLAFILLDVILLQNGISPLSVVSVLLAVGLSSALIVADCLNLRRQGQPAPTLWWALFAVPGYLVARRKRLGQSWILPLVWVGAALAYLAAGSTVGALGAVELDPAIVEHEVEQGYREYGDMVAVDCPDPSIAPVGGTVQCSATYGDGTVAEVVITVENTQGWFSWQESW